MNMDEHEGIGETMHVHYRPSYKWMGECIKRRGLKATGKSILFLPAGKDEFSLARLGRQIFSFYASQRREISRVANGVAQ